MQATAIAILILCSGSAVQPRGVLPDAPSTASAPAETLRTAAPQAAAPTLPDRLSDADFWALVSSISEPGGYFRIVDNFTSNEPEVARLFTMLRDKQLTGGVYVGVGPEQNLTYIAAIKPAMAFILDIRRQALIQHLLFKAVFELAADRAEFIALLFAKPRPPGLDGETPIQQMWSRFAAVPTDYDFAAKNAARIVDRLKTHRFTLTPGESTQLDAVRAAFVLYGPDISTRGWGGVGRSGGSPGGGTFADLTGWAADDMGTTQSFLSDEAHFQFLKTLHEKNLIVPVSGDFGGPKALRAIGAYVQAHGAVVTAFYVSNVEQYLFPDEKARAFYDNVATLPVTDTSVFIRPYAFRRSRWAGEPLCPIAAFLREVRGGRIVTNNDALACIR